MRSSFAALDASPGLLEAARRTRPGFVGGAAWLALALETLRRTPVRAAAASYTLAGVAKYAAATAAGLVVGTAVSAVVVAWSAAPAMNGDAPLALPSSALPQAVAAALGFTAGFYLAEAPAVYLFPSMIDGERRPWRAALDLMRQDGGWLRTAVRTAGIAASMVCGGFLGRGFLRSWCAGCLVVAARYESLRKSSTDGGRP